MTDFTTFTVAWLGGGRSICEGPDTLLREQLTCATGYGSYAPRKVFELERLACWLPTTQPQCRTLTTNTFNFAWSASWLSTKQIEAFISDGLKIAIREQGCPQYRKAFNEVRKRFISSKPGVANQAASDWI